MALVCRLAMALIALSYIENRGIKKYGLLFNILSYYKFYFYFAYA